MQSSPAFARIANGTRSLLSARTASSRSRSTNSSPAGSRMFARSLTAIGRVPTEAVPSAFAVDPAGNFVFVAGTASGRLASYPINGEAGALTPLATYDVGQRPAAVLAARLGV